MCLEKSEEWNLAEVGDTYRNEKKVNYNSNVVVGQRMNMLVLALDWRPVKVEANVQRASKSVAYSHGGVQVEMWLYPLLHSSFEC